MYKTTVTIIYVKLFIDNRKQCLRNVTFYTLKVNSQVFSVYTC